MRHKIVLSSFILALLSPAPAVLAQNECGATDGLPGTADTATCDPADYDSGYPNGITYSSNGDFTLEIPDGADTLNVFDDGISVTGNLDDNIFLDASTFTDTIEGTDGAVIDYSTDTGNIDIDAPAGHDQFLNGVRGVGNATHGIRAISAGDGNIDIFSAGRITNSNDVPEFTGIEARTAGGDIDIVTLSTISRSGNLDIIRRGIIAETSGAGGIVIDVGGEVFAGVRAAAGEPAPDNGQTAIYAETGTGNIAIAVDRVELASSNNNIGIHALTQGAIDLDIGTIASAENRENQTGILTENSQFVTIDIAGEIDDETTTAIRSSGGGALVNVLAGSPDDVDDRTGIYGALDFSGLTDGAEVNFGANRAWILGVSDSVFSSGDDTLSTVSSSVIRQISFPSSAAEKTTVVDFGEGTDTVNNAGTLITSVINFQAGPGGIRDSDRTGFEGELRLENLETFNNSGTLYLGFRDQDDDIGPGDGAFDDILAMPGTDFVGSGDSKLVVDVFLNTVGDPDGSCDSSARDANGDLPGSDCVDLRGGTASGRTEVVFNTRIPGDRGAVNPDGFLIVDLAGGSADPDAFVVSPESDFYSPQFGGVVNKGLYFYPLAYDADKQQFRLYGQPAAPAQQLVILGNVANDLWRTSANAWFGRRFDQRHVEAESGLGGGAWIRFTSSSAERDLITPIVAGVETFGFDNSYTQDDSAMTLGVDLISRSEGNSAWVAGAMLGYARSRVDFDAHPNWANLEGLNFGLYGSLTSGDFFVDAAVNVAEVDMDYDAPALDLFPEGTLLGTDITSLGAQLEAGWGGLQFWRLGIEPLATLSYVKSSIEDISVPAADPTRLGGNFEFDDPKSFRGGLGARLSISDVLPGFAPTDLSLTARAVEEFEGESTATITSTGPIPVDQTDTFDGTFTEVTGSINVTNTAKTVSGYLNVDAAFGDDYDSLGAELGFRYQW